MRFLYSRSLMLVFLGIVIGNVTAAAFVHAWTSPTQAPPNGNTPTPLNVGSGNQTKTGGMLQVYDLWVNGALGVTGGISASQYCFSGGANCITQWPTSQWLMAGTSMYYNSGNVGIGTNTPGSSLTVQGSGIDNMGPYKQYGTIVLYASSTNRSVSVGATSSAVWMSAQSAVNDNIAMGVGAMATNPNVNSWANVAIGYKSMNANTGGYSNIAMGYQTLMRNTVGWYNVALGYRSMETNTGGYYNTAVGAGALRNITDGYQNSAFGYDTMGWSNGAWNSAFGSNAMWQSSTGSDNVAVGSGALFSNTSPTSTTALGRAAAGGTAVYTNQGGTYVGYRSGYSASTGSDFNTMVGYQSGYDVTTGQHNTIIGTQASPGTGITTGSNNILIGRDVRNGLSQTGSNQLNIGNLVYGTSIASGATASTGNVGIGTASPATTLDVNGPIRPGSATVGGVCSPEGAMAYDLAAHLPVYCNQSARWASVASAGGVFSGKYTNYTGSSARLLGTTYTNTGTTPRLVIVSAQSICGACGRVNMLVTVDGVVIAQKSAVDGNGQYGFLSLPTAMSFVVPAGSTYVVSISSSGQKDYWAELQ